MKVVHGAALLKAAHKEFTANTLAAEQGRRPFFQGAVLLGCRSGIRAADRTQYAAFSYHP
ncbi:MAG TPA: hypothetical protein VKZ53_08725 [Candidatus Angelobacter sp.]|nr:hypothetical protein [Candidatus Angelobacter sp.]